MQDKVLILGASGFIGSRLCSAWSPSQYVATFCHQPITGGVSFDVATQRLGDRFLLRGHQFTHCIMAQGITKLDRCSDGAAFEANVTGTLKAVDDLVDAGIHVIFLSSDAVFDGTRRTPKESDTPRPTIEYGRQKLVIESHLSGKGTLWTILRLTKVIAGFADDRNLLNIWTTDIAQSRTIRCAKDQILTPIDVDDVVRALDFFVSTNTAGLYHVAGSQSLTRYELIQSLLLRLPWTLRRHAVVDACLLSDIPAIEPLRQNCSLDNSKFKRITGMALQTVEEICSRFSRQVWAHHRSGLCELAKPGHIGSLRTLR